MKIFKFKGKYLGTINSLKKKGFNMIVMKYVNTWLDDNIDNIFEKFKNSELAKNVKLTTR